MAVNKKKKQAAQEDDFFEYDDAFTINEEDISGARRRSDRKRGNDAGRGAERGSEAKKTVPRRTALPIKERAGKTGQKPMRKNRRNGKSPQIRHLSEIR